MNHRSHRPRVALLLLLLSARSALSAEPLAETTMLDVAAPSGWAISPDLVTMVVAQPKTAELLYLDTINERLIKRVELEFAPGVMLLRGNSLFVAGQGSGVIHELDPPTGKERRQFVVPGNAISDLAGSPTSSRLYAATTTYEVYSIDLRTKKVTKTEARGNRVVIDPKNGNRVYTGLKRNDNSRDVLIVKTGPDGDLRFVWDRWGPRSGIMAYTAQGANLKLKSAQTNATVNGYTLELFPDGKRIMMTGGGGWRPPAGGNAGDGGYPAVFSTQNLETMLGKGPGGNDIALHPVLRIGVSNHVGRDLKIFDSRSYIEKQTIHIADGADMRPLLLTFAGKGTKVAVWNGDNPKNSREGLHFVPFKLSSQDRTMLATRFGKLPEQRIALTESVSPKVTPKVTSNPKPSKKTRPKTTPVRRTRIPAGVVAMAGFNNRKGLGARPGRQGLYPLDASNRRAGTGEHGWSGPWPALEKATFQTQSVFEGDGALHLAGTANLARGFARPLTGTVEVEQYIRLPASGNVTCYVWEKNHASCGPMWRVKGGQFEALDGDARGSGKWNRSGVSAEEDKWIKVVVEIDTAKQRWKLKLPGNDYVSAELKYRGAARQLLAINYLAEAQAGVFIDAIQIRQAKSK